MKSMLYLILAITIISCSKQNELPILKTTSKTISIKDGQDLHEDMWTISPEVELDEFVVRKFTGEKKVLFMSDIDTITFDVKPNNTYDFIIQYNKEKAFTRINTDTLKEVSIPFLDYYYDTKTKVALTDTIPFIVGDDHRIHLKGSVNGSDSLDFLFDTGANSISVVSRLIGKKVNLVFDGKNEDAGSDGVHMVETSSSNKLEIQNLNWDNVSLQRYDANTLNFEGVLGWIAFEKKIIEINYNKNLLIIHKSMETVPKGFSKVETKMIRGIPYIKGTITVGNNKNSGWFEYDSGSNGVFSMSQRYASENNLNGTMKKVGTSVSSGSAGIKWKANDYILPKIKIGTIELSNIKLSIHEKDPKGVEFNDILGNKFLKRFNAIIDLQDFQIYLKQNNLSDSKSE